MRCLLLIRLDSVSFGLLLKRIHLFFKICDLAAQFVHTKRQDVILGKEFIHRLIAPGAFADHHYFDAQANAEHIEQGLFERRAFILDFGLEDIIRAQNQQIVFDVAQNDMLQQRRQRRVMPFGGFLNLRPPGLHVGHAHHRRLIRGSSGTGLLHWRRRRDLDTRRGLGRGAGSGSSSTTGLRLSRKASFKRKLRLPAASPLLQCSVESANGGQQRLTSNGVRLLA